MVRNMAVPVWQQHSVRAVAVILSVLLQKGFSAAIIYVSMLRTGYTAVPS